VSHRVGDLSGPKWLGAEEQGGGEMRHSRNKVDSLGVVSEHQSAEGRKKLQGGGGAGGTGAEFQLKHLKDLVPLKHSGKRWGQQKDGNYWRGETAAEQPGTLLMYRRVRVPTGMIGNLPWAKGGIQQVEGKVFNLKPTRRGRQRGPGDGRSLSVEKIGKGWGGGSWGQTRRTRYGSSENEVAKLEVDRRWCKRGSPP